MAATVAKMGDSNKGRPVNRPREQRPKSGTPAGLTMLYVADLMKRKGISVDAVADDSGINRATIFRWLRGQGSPTLDQLDALAKALGRKDCWALQPPKDFKP